jgi:ABC-2 type transport system permease protein
MRLSGVLTGRMRLARGSFRRGVSTGTARPAWADVVITVLLGAVMLHGTGIVFDRLVKQGHPVTEAGTVLGMILVSAFMALALFEVHLALTTLVLDSDLELLRVAPLTPAQLLLIKLIDATPATGAVFAVFAIPAILSFGRAYGLPAWGWGIVPPLLLGLWLVPLGIGMALSLLVLRAVPSRIVRETLGVVSTLTVTVVLVVNAFLMPRVAGDAQSFARSLVVLGQRLGDLERWLPPLWASRALVLASTSHAGPALGRTAMVVLTAVLSLAALGWVAQLSLEPVMSRLVGVASRGRGRPDAAKSIGTSRFGHGLFATLVRRDLRLFMREWTVLSDVALAAILWPVAGLLLPQMEEGLGATVFRTLLLVLGIGMGMEVAARSVPLERDAVIWNRLAGVASRRWALAKAAAAGILALPVLVGAALLMSSVMDLRGIDWIGTVLISVAALGLSIAVGVWVGTRFADREWTHPRAMIRLAGRLLAGLLVLVQVSAWLVATLLAGEPPLVLAPPVLATGLLFAILAAAGDCLDGQLEGSRFSDLKPRN